MGNGAEAMTTTPAELGKLIQTEMAKWRKAIEAAGVKPR